MVSSKTTGKELSILYMRQISGLSRDGQPYLPFSEAQLSSLHQAQPPPRRPRARLREGGGRREGEGIFTAGRPAGGAEEGSRPKQEEQRGEGGPLSPSLPLKTSLVSITSD